MKKFIVKVNDTKYNVKAKDSKEAISKVKKFRAKDAIDVKEFVDYLWRWYKTFDVAKELTLEEQDRGFSKQEAAKKALKRLPEIKKQLMSEINKVVNIGEQKQREGLEQIIKQKKG